MNAQRNDPCPCGSGQKYKNCCMGRGKVTRGFTPLLVTVGAVAAIGVVAMFASNDDRNRARTPQSQLPAVPQTVQTPRPQPPGPAPAGKVWSPEHGHWHDANTGAAPQPTPENPITFNRRNIPQPPGPVPEGKVWSPEHGHWHTKKR